MNKSLTSNIQLPSNVASLLDINRSITRDPVEYRAINGTPTEVIKRNVIWFTNRDNLMPTRDWNAPSAAAMLPCQSPESKPTGRWTLCDEMKTDFWSSRIESSNDDGWLNQKPGTMGPWDATRNATLECESESRAFYIIISSRRHCVARHCRMGMSSRFCWVFKAAADCGLVPFETIIM